jgi:DNA-binding NtrC family response regulator
LHDLAPQERVLVAFTSIDGADFLRHSPSTDHGARKLRSSTDIVVGAGADRTEERLLRRPPSEQRKVDVQIVAATNRDLEQAIETGLFRSDLFYRLSSVCVELPSLSERKDVADIAETLLRNIDQRFNLSEDARALLDRIAFPGNVRELRSILTQACVRSSTTVIDGDMIRSLLPNRGGNVEAQQEITEPSSRFPPLEGAGSRKNQGCL